MEVPLLVDADRASGNAVSTYHAVRTLERTGADSAFSSGTGSTPAAATSMARP